MFDSNDFGINSNKPNLSPYGSFILRKSVALSTGGVGSTISAEENHEIYGNFLWIPFNS